MFEIVKSRPNTTGNIVIDRYDTIEEARDRLATLAERRVDDGWEVDEIEVDTLECVADWEADTLLYFIRHKLDE